MHALTNWTIGFDEKEIRFILIVIDKLLLLLITVVGAYFLAKAMERYRRSQALSLELGKQRAAALARASRCLARLEQGIARHIGGPVGTMTLGTISDAEAQDLRRRVSRSVDEHIQESNNAAALITENLVLLGDEADALLAYYGAIVRVFSAIIDQSIPIERVTQLIPGVLKARKALSSLFPKFSRA